jgi:hypothetical protein
MATFWPLTMRGGWIPKSLLKTNASFDRLGAYHTFRLLSQNAKGTSVACESDYDGVYSFAVSDGEVLRVFCIARPTRQADGGIALTIEIAGRRLSSCSGVLVSAADKETLDITTEPWDISCKDGKTVALLPALGAGMVEIR